MILLDTDIVSRSMRVHPDEKVIGWMDRQPASSLFLSAVTLDEITYGIEILPPGRRKSRLRRVFSEIVDAFEGRVESLDAQAAAESAKARAQRRQVGLPMAVADSQIAGIARSKGFSLATLNVKDFLGVGLALVEPK